MRCSGPTAATSAGRPPTTPASGEKVVSDAVKALKPGEMTPVITTSRGAYLILAEAQREKNLTYDQVKHEIAAELAREVWSKEAAKRAAIKALSDARESGKKLADLYASEVKPGPDLQELLRKLSDPDTDPQVKEFIRLQLQQLQQQQQQQQIQQQLQQQLQGGDDQGSIVIESPDVYASWKAGDSMPTGGAAGSAPAPATPAAGGPAPAAGTPAPAPAPVVASNDVLPAFQDVPQPKLRQVGPVPREKKLPGLDVDGVKAVFDELGKDELAKRVFEADGHYTVVQVTDKAQAKIEDFEKDSARIIDQMRKQRGEQLVRDWVKARCEELTAAGKIKPRADKTAEYNDKGEPLPTTYRPCMTL